MDVGRLLRSGSVSTIGTAILIIQKGNFAKAEHQSSTWNISFSSRTSISSLPETNTATFYTLFLLLLVHSFFHEVQDGRFLREDSNLDF
jgi:hypothetical protein